MKEVRFSKHALERLEEIQAEGLPVTKQLVIQAIFEPDSLEIMTEDKRLAQKQISDHLLIRVVYRDFEAFILTITVHPGTRSRYEKN